MFTGLVEETGTVRRVEPKDDSVRLWVDARVTAKGARLGDSIASLWWSDEQFVPEGARPRVPGPASPLISSKKPGIAQTCRQ